MRIPWFYEHKKLSSSHNADIELFRIFGQWSVYVNGYDQTTRYLRVMWQRAFRKLPKDFKPKRILMLGLGAGGEIKTISKKFPKAHLVAVEHDPAMVTLTKELGLYKPFPLPEIMIGDAKDLVPQVAGTFELIIVDIFTGKHPSLLSQNPDFLHDLKQKLHPRGWLLINVYTSNNLLNALSSQFSHWHSLHYKRSSVGFFRHHGLGLVGESLPDTIIIPHSIPSYVAYDTIRGKITTSQYHNGTRVTWKAKPVKMEQYYGDTEPPKDTLSGNLIFWQPITLTKRPKGWWPAPFMLNLGMSGYAFLDSAAYWQSWTDTAQTQRKQWLAQTRYTIQNISYDDFAYAFRHSTVYKAVHETPLLKLKKKLDHTPKHVHLYSAIDSATGDKIAGLAVLDFPEQNFSLHLTAFVHDNAPHYISTGLIDHWFQQSINKKLHHLDLGQFYAPGYPKSWHGFSRFKSQFGTTFIRYPKIWMKVKLKK